MEWHWFHAVVIGLAIPVALILFGRAVILRKQLMTRCAPVPDPIEDRNRRIMEVLTVFLGQRKLFQKAAAGLMHALIFWGFLILLLRALTLFGMAFAGFDFHLPFLGDGSALGNFYSILKDVTNVIVAAMVIYALIRRYLIKVPRLLNNSGALFVLCMILMLMMTDIGFDGIHRVALGKGFSIWAPVASLTATMIRLGNADLTGGLILLGHLFYFAHCLGILVFLVYLPMGKHMHIITSIFNVYLRPLFRSGRLTKLDLEDETIESFGVTKMEEYTWKDTLDLYTCTECGRCNDACPAKRTGKKLAPREITIEQKHFLMDEESDRIMAQEPNQEPVKQLVPEVITPEEIWACTTCQACEQACPVNISYVQRINSMRRAEVLNKSEFPNELKRVFKGLENNSNPWGVGASKRMEWAANLDLPTFNENPDAEYLLYLGCAAAIDDRAQKISRKLVELLNDMNVSYAVLGEDEQCCGETARRLGEEALGQMLMEGNVELFKELGVKKILTPCPHCFNTFKNEYPDMDGKFEVVHHSQLIAQLLTDGKLTLIGNGSSRIAIHDSCYLTRINGELDAPRKILNSVPGIAVAEAAENREHGFCCGAGGGMFWLEEEGDRINNERFRQLAELKPDAVATSCPYCLRMLEDASKDTGNAHIPVKDILEFAHWEK